MEYFDVLDSEGNKLGIKKSRSEVHRDGDWHKAVNVWIINSECQVLLQKRATAKESYPNYWDLSCAGHVDAGEEPIQTATRELKEELGVEANPQDLKHLCSVHEEHFLNNGSYIDREIREIYLLLLDRPTEDFQLQTAEVSLVKWLLLDEFEAMTKNMPADLVPHDKEYEIIFPLLRQEI